MTKIVVLDGYLLNPGDLSWQPLEQLGECQFYERTLQTEVINRSLNHDIIITNKVLLGKTEFEACPSIRYVGVTATGYNIIDIDAAKEKGIVVTNVPGYSTYSTAQHSFALLLEICNQVGFHNQTVQSGNWVSSPNFAYWKKPLIELNHLKLGIVGFGTIGRTVARLGSAFGMQILANNRSKIESSEIPVKQLDLETLFRESDVISLHCPLTEATRELINEKTLAWMKPTAILINAARGGLVNEADLAKALSEKRIYAAGLDVLSNEPPTADCPLLNLENCIITPHNAWASKAARQRLLDITVANIAAFLQGKPINVVS